MIYGWLGELIELLNRMPGSITLAIATLCGCHMATSMFLSACLSSELPDYVSHFLSCFFLALSPSHFVSIPFSMHI